MTRTERGPLALKGSVYGYSVNSIPLKMYGPGLPACRMLVMGSMHGDESIGTVLLSECLRGLAPEVIQTAVIPVVNPDGVLAGTRCNANGVDLNRNYPSSNWSSSPVYYRNRPGGEQNIALSPGDRPGSEPETQALISLIHRLEPDIIVSLHGFLACIDDPEQSMISQELSRRTQLALVADIGYSTPGSFGSWCAENAQPIITYELPSLGMDELRDIHLPVLMDLLSGAYNGMI